MKTIGITLAAVILLGTGLMLWGMPHSLDTRFYYTGLQAADFFTSLSPADHRRYLLTELTDLLFIISYTRLAVLLFRRENLSLAVAVFPGVMDLVETLTVLRKLAGLGSPDFMWLGYFTALKWASGPALIAYFLWGKLRPRRS